jgi:hypothetical protein
MYKFNGKKLINEKKMEINLSKKLYMWRKMDIRDK